jgi:hypothetical protein
VDDGRQVRAYAAIIAVASVGVAAWVLGRTGSPVCDPDGTFQFHGLWHVISSLVLGMWWWLAMWLPSRPDARVARAGRRIGADHGRAR